MKIKMAIRLSADRITAVLDDERVLYDEASLVVLEEASDGRRLISGIGAAAGTAAHRERRHPALSVADFQPDISAGVVAGVTMIGWGRLHQRFLGLAAAMDRLDVTVDIVGYEGLSITQQREFISALPYHPQITWWVSGIKVRA